VRLPPFSRQPKSGLLGPAALLSCSSSELSMRDEGHLLLDSSQVITNWVATPWYAGVYLPAT
jgi:hypothetical protein